MSFLGESLIKEEILHHRISHPYLYLHLKSGIIKEYQSVDISSIISNLVSIQKKSNVEVNNDKELSIININLIKLELIREDIRNDKICRNMCSIL
jgi:hypothetical protein